MNKLNEILKSELIESMGCTEPSAIALAVAYAKERLMQGECVKKVEVGLSSNVLKNALCVTIPNTNECGIKMIVALALVKCNSINNLKILSDISDKDILKASSLLKKIEININLVEDCNALYIAARVHSNNHTIEVVVENKHDKIKSCVIDGVMISQSEIQQVNFQDKEKFKFEEILDFIESDEIDFDILQKVKKYNLEIADFGVENSLGLGVGNYLKNIEFYNEKFRNIVAKTVGGIDSRMSGVAKKVYINSGSGNQGITATIPVIELSKILGVSEKQQLKALALSHLTAIYIRSTQGRLSSSCGAICASAGVAAAVAYLLGCSNIQIQGAVTNMLCSNFGVFCDGAKSSCSLKVASAVSAALVSGYLAKDNSYIKSNLGVISKSLDDTLMNLSKIEHEFTLKMDKTILEAALNNV